MPKPRTPNKGTQKAMGPKTRAGRLPPQKTEGNFNGAVRVLFREHGKAPNLKAFARFRIPHLMKLGYSKDRAVLELMKELGKNPLIRPWGGDERKGWFVERETKRDDKGIWRATTIYPASSASEPENSHESAQQSLGGATRVMGPGSRGNAGAPNLPRQKSAALEIREGVNWLRKKTANWKFIPNTSMGVAYNTFNRAARLAEQLLPEGRGIKETSKSKELIRTAGLSGRKAKFTRLLNQAIRLAGLVEKEERRIK